jgi:hypothetical protein
MGNLNCCSTDEDKKIELVPGGHEDNQGNFIEILD